MHRHTHHRIWIVTGISLLLHILVLGGWWYNKPQHEIVLNIPASQFSVTLQTVEVRPESRNRGVITESSIKTVKPVKPDSVPVSSRKPATQKLTPVRQVTANNTSLQQSNTQDDYAASYRKQQTNESTTETPVSEQRTEPALNRAQIISRLHDDFESYFYYPPLAQRKNIQGTVTLGFGISSQGLIHDIQVIKSSGFAILDLAAEDALQQLKQVDWIQDRISEDNIDIELPVKFILTER